MRLISSLVLTFAFFSGIFFTIPQLAFAQQAPDCAVYQRTDPPQESAGIFNGVSCDCVDKGTCTAEDFAIVSFAIARFIFGAAGVIALLFFIAGGVFMLVSGGNQDLITRGKQTLRGAFFGLLIIFLAWIIVNAIVWAITGNPGATIFGTPWAQFRTN